MPEDLRVLILSASYGDGHIQVSRALASRFAEKGCRNVQIVDLFAEAHPYINALMRALYLKTYSFAPFLYGWVYYGSQSMSSDKHVFKWLNSFGLRKLQAIMREERPDVVINTFPMYTLLQWRQKAKQYIPIYTVLTDFTLHQRWIHPEIDRYYVATEDIKRKMIQHGVAEQRIRVSGIPLRDVFAKPFDKKAIERKYQLKPGKKYVLVMAGAYGVLQNIDRICQNLLSDPDLHVLLVCGKNESLQKEMLARFSQHSAIRIFGFVEDVHELMSISSCIVTKAGGITLSEALAFHLPIIVFRPVPGQERDNALYLARKNAALVVQHPDELVRQIVYLLHDPERLEKMRQAAAQLQKRTACETVVCDVLQELGATSRSTV